jgi:hypothetical protein
MAFMRERRAGGETTDGQSENESERTSDFHD